MSTQTHVEKSQLTQSEIMDVMHTCDSNSDDKIQVELRNDKKVIWINIDGICVFRAKSDVDIEVTIKD